MPTINHSKSRSMKPHTSENKLSDIKLHYIQQNLSGDNILDVGAGYCYYSEWLLNHYPHLNIVALDQLDLANLGNIDFIQTDLEKPIPLPNNSFTTILAFDIIEHIANEQNIINELYRICSNDGILLGSVPHDDDKFLPTYNLTFYHRSDVTHKRYYTPSSLETTLKNAGFTILAMDCHGVVSPQVIAEFFPSSTRFIIKKIIGGLRRMHIVNAHILASDIFFVAKKITSEQR